jgi:hypothetical protein
MMRHPVALYMQATAHTHEGHFELFESSKTRPRKRRLFGFFRRSLRPAHAEVLYREAATPDGSTA